MRKRGRARRKVVDCEVRQIEMDEVEMRLGVVVTEMR